MIPTTKVSSLNERFRKAFLDELPARLAEIEAMLLALERGGRRPGADVLAELYRAVHSIKGSAATFGQQILAAICHPFEEIIQDADQVETLPSSLLEVSRGYLELLRQSVDDIRHGCESFDGTEKKLARLHERAFQQRFSLAVVANSRTLRQICVEMAKAFDARVVEFEDSLNAMQRMLGEPFHLVIVSSELYPMRGEALIAAMKLSRRAKRLKSVLVSSDRDKVGFVKRDIDPDFVVLRDTQFLPRLHAVISEVHEAHDQASQSAQ